MENGSIVFATFFAEEQSLRPGLMTERSTIPPEPRLPIWVQYTVAAASIVAVTAARWFLDAALGDHLPFAGYLVAVALTAWFTSLGPSVFALVLGTVVAGFLFAARPLFPGGQASVASQVGLALYLVVGAVIILVSENVRRSRNREELRRRQLEITVASIGDAVITTDSNGCVASLNRVAEMLTGWKDADARGRELHEVFQIVNEETREPVENPVAKVLASGIILGLANHTVLIAKDGTERPIDDSAAPIRDLDGEIRGVVLVFRDISERRRAERERLHLAAIVSSSDDAIIGKSLDGTITSWNRGAESLYGYTAGEIVGKPISVLMPPENDDEFSSIMERLRRGEQIAHHETVRVRKGGERLVVSVTISPIRSESGEIIGASAIARDITTRAREEQHFRFLSRTGELFSQSLDFDRTMQNVLAMAVPELADWAILDLASSDDEASYRRVAVAHVDPEKADLAKVLRRKYPPDPQTDHVARAMRSGESELVQEVSEDVLREVSQGEEHFQLLRELGLTSWMIVPLPARDRPIGAVTFVSSDPRRRFNDTDLAHAKEFARRAAMAFENARLYREAQLANRAKDNYLATLSHELRTPMTSIIGWASMLGQHDVDAETQKLGIESIQRSAAVQAELIEDILDMSRIASGKMRLDVQMCDLAEIAAAALTTIAPAASAKSIVLAGVTNEPMLVTGDPKRLQQVIWNLLTNAIKFTPRGGRVNLRVEEANSWAHVTVSDTGQGFSREFGAHLFEPFRQAESPTTRTQGGLGLGLSIVRYLVEQHGGVVTAESAGPGAGATFCVRIPVRALKDDDSFAGTASPIRLASPNDGAARPCANDELQDLRVLFVDDQEDARELFRRLLERCGANVDVAGSVDAAIDCFTRKRFDVVVTDIAMPGRDGFDLIAWLERQATRASFRIVALTAFGSVDDEERILATGCDAYLKKPVEPVDLIATIGRLTDRCRPKES